MNFLSRLTKRPRPDHSSTRKTLSEGAYFKSVARTHVGKVRSLNEDRFVEMPEAGVWAIADGMGGHHAGDVAAQMLAEAVERAVAGTAEPAKAERVAGAVHGVNAELHRMRRLHGLAGISGATFIALIAGGGRYQLLWAGDSRAYRFRDGRCSRISRDHSVVQELIDAGVVAPSASASHPQAHVVTRAVGATRALHLDFGEGDIANGDLFLLCSDGLSDIISPAVLDAILASASIEVAADALLSAALKAGAPDNVTFIIIETS